MPTDDTVSTGGLAGAIVLALAIALVWILTIGTLSDLSGSDAMGNGLSRAFAAIGLVVLWVLLAVLLLIAAVKGVMPPAAVLAAFVLLPATAVAAFVAQNLLIDPRITPHLWPLVVPAAPAPIIVAFSLWALLPGLRRIVPATIAVAIFIAGLAGACIVLGPMINARNVEVARLNAENERIERAYASLPANASLAELLPFLTTQNAMREDEVLKRITQRPERQRETEAMLAHGDFPLKYLGRIDLDPTPSLCDKARAELRQRVEPLKIDKQDSRPYADIADDVGGALAAMRWLVGYGCPCDEESLSWEQMASKYRDTNYDLYELKDLRDPKLLGETLRDNPDKFSMLSEQSSLRGWLKFADQDELRAKAIAGARKLDHRNADAIAMLKSDEFTAWTALEFLPQLDLVATPELCTAALAQVHRELEPIYRPTADDPRPYHELEDRMGTGEPLAALIWLARHGCAARDELEEAEQLVRSYQDSPERAAMLATLGELQDKR